MIEKACFKCGKVLPIDMFYAHPQMADGHLNKCKECTKADNRNNRLRNIVHYKLYDRRRYSTPKRQARYEEDRISGKYQESHKMALERYRHNPSTRAKTNARATLKRAVQNGLLVKAPCEICGSIKSEAHHEDYAKPLDVVWLCPKHHKWIHR